ncbi:MAG TPA: XrtA system polysaccharide deacetylase [Candidatus Polarisedimenticolaceae bacterium]|nr:XrtA system polysaccharide deacetylase [Candidatus Polarisedimenticolaceae bacterium]
MLNAISVDVEEHFQVSAFEGAIPRDDWASQPSRVEANTERLLELFAAAGVQATFFVLGWLAERRPKLVARLAEQGHEIACHGYSHHLVYRQRPEEFREETLRARRILQDASGQPVRGYRAASFSIGRANLWALDVLAEAGFDYDSSLFPVIHDRYGMPGAPRQIHRVTTPAGRTLVEVPPSTLAFGPATFPVAGGGYLRIYPQALTRWAIRRLNRRERMPAIVYLHPWELDPDQPRLQGPLSSRLRHYTGLSRFEAKLRRLLSEFRFGSMAQVIDAPELAAGTAGPG